MGSAPFVAWASVLGGWAAVGTVLYGLGCLVTRWLGPASDEPTGPLVRFWLGWSAALGLLQLWHFALPIDGRVYLALAPLGALGLFSRRAAILESARRGLTTPRGALAAAAVALVAACAAALALHRPCNPDSCLYHIATIRWFEQHPIVPGLGNANLRLAFNHAYYLYASLFDVGPLRGNGERLANGLLLLGILAPACLVLLGLLDLRRPHPNSSYLTVALAGVMIDLLLGCNLPSPTADVAVATTGAVLILLAIGPTIDGAELTPFRLRAIGVIAIAAVIAKPSAVIVAAPFALFAAAEAFRREGAHATWRRTASILAIAALVVVVPWLVRGAVLSGYPLFPAEIGDLGLPWRLPAGVGHRELLYERAFARMRADANFTADYPWVRHWLSLEWLENREFLIPVVTLLAAGTLAAVLALRHRRRLPMARSATAVGAALVLWWVLAPDPRFAMAPIWCAASLAVLCALELVPWKTASAPRATRLVLALAVVAGAFSEPWRISLSFAKDFEPPGPERFVEGRLGTGEPVRVSGGCCLEPTCVWGDPANVYLRTPGDFSSGFCSGAGCNR
jgi:hypothetical protein